MAAKPKHAFSASNPGRSRSCNISLLEYHINTIRKHKKEANLRGDSQSIQNMIEYWDKTHNKTFFKNILVFIIYPILFAFTLNRIANALYDLNNSMISEGLKFDALYLFANTINLFGFAVSAFGVTCVIAFIYIIKTRGY